MGSAKEGMRNAKIITGIVTGSLTGSLLSGTSVAFAGIQFKSYQTHSHVAVSVDPSVEYRVEKIEQNGKVVGLRLVLDNINEELESLAKAEDTRTDGIKVTRSAVAGNGKVVYEFHLSDKAKAIGIEYFDYRNKVPSEIALDYWLKNQKAGSNVAEQSLKTSLKPAAEKPARRKLAHVSKAAKHEPVKSTAPNFAGCGQPLNHAVDGGTLWKVYHKPFNYRAFFNLMPADANYAYPGVTPKKGELLGARSKEVAHYRLCFKLYKEGKYALVLRSIDFFEKQYAASAMRPELEFLKASTLVQLSRLLRTERYMDQALDLYRSILLEQPDSERARLSLAFLVQQLMDRGTPVFALEYALMGADQGSKDPNDMTRWVYRLASAEALFVLGEHDRAERALQLIMDQGNAISPEAAFRMGEVFSSRKLFERAILAYEKAIRQFSAEANRFPTAFFNLAEAYFRIGRHDEAERVYREFEKRFTNDSALWAVEVRLAELEQMKVKATDVKAHERIKGLYEEIVNRHPYSPGATMAELRLSTCYRDLKAGDGTRQFFENLFGVRDLKKLESPLVEPAEVELWLDLSECRFNLYNGNYRAALKRADDYRQKLAKLELGESFKKVFAEAVLKLAAKLSKDGNEKELLAVVEHYGDLAPRPEPVPYLMAITKAKQAQKDYNAVASGLTALEGRLAEATDAEKDLFHLLKARQGRALGEKADRLLLELGQIRDQGELVLEKYDELAQAAADKGDYKGAVAYDSRVLETELAKKVPAVRRFELAVRRLDNLSRYEMPAEVARQSEYALLKFGALTESAELLNRVRDLHAKSLYEAGDFKGANEAFNEILTAQPNHPRRTEFEYMRGKSLTKLGREGEALEAFRKLAQAADNNDVWKKSAQAELDQIQWETNVEKQIKGTGGL